MDTKNLTNKEFNFISHFYNEKFGYTPFRYKDDLGYLNIKDFFTLLKKDLYKLTIDNQIIAKNLILKNKNYETKHIKSSSISRFQTK